VRGRRFPWRDVPTPHPARKAGPPSPARGEGKPKSAAALRRAATDFLPSPLAGEGPGVRGRRFPWRDVPTPHPARKAGPPSPARGEGKPKSAARLIERIHFPRRAPNSQDERILTHLMSLNPLGSTKSPRRAQS